jgi:putative ABC transport system substrate-binding protein
MKRMQLLKELIPRLHRVIVLVDPDDPSLPRVLKEIREAGAILKLELIERPVRTQSDVEHRLQSSAREVEGLVVGSSSLMTKFPSLVIRLAAKSRLALPGHRKEWAEQGALFSYGADFRSVGRDAARLVDKILKGAKPADLPVEEPTKFELVINLKTAKMLGLTVPSSLMLRADQIIE